MTNRDHAAKSCRTESDPTISLFKPENVSTRLLPKRFQKSKASFLAFIAVSTLMFSDKPSFAEIDQSKLALDVVRMLPEKEDVSEQPPVVKPIGPAEATVSSVKAITGLMKQAIDVAAMLPKEEKQAQKPLSEMEKAFYVAAMVPRSSSSADPLELLKTRGFKWPADGFIYSAFNATRGKNRRHGAIDIVTKKGTPIAAAADGVVTVATNGGKLFSGYGKVVIVDHGKGVHTLYSHCDSILVKMGQRVKQGEYIGTVGRTGRATTDHVHFEVRVAGKKLDPLNYLPDRPGMVKAINWRSPKKAK